MGLLKAEFFRFFALGFGGAALLLFATIGIGGHDAGHGVVPSALAAESQ